MKIETFNRKIVPMRKGLQARARQLTGDDDARGDCRHDGQQGREHGRDGTDWHDCRQPAAAAMPHLPNEGGGFKSAAGLHVKAEGSYTWGITAFGMGIPFNSQHTFGVTTAIQGGYTRHMFNPDYAMFNVDGQTMLLPLDEDEGAERSYVSYWYMRLPVIFECQKHVNGNEAYAGIGLSIEMRAKEHSRYKDGKSGTITPTSDLNMNPYGLNLEAHVGYSCFVFSLRTALTPLFNTSVGPRCNPVSFTMGFKL